MKSPPNREPRIAVAISPSPVARVGPDASGILRQRVEQCMQSLIPSSEGDEVKTTGDAVIESLEPLLDEDQGLLVRLPESSLTELLKLLAEYGLVAERLDAPIKAHREARENKQDAPDGDNS